MDHKHPQNPRFAMPRRQRATAFPVPLRWTAASGSHGSCDRLHSTASAGGAVDVCHSSRRLVAPTLACRVVALTTQPPWASKLLFHNRAPPQPLFYPENSTYRADHRHEGRGEARTRIRPIVPTNSGQNKSHIQNCIRSLPLLYIIVLYSRY